MRSEALRGSESGLAAPLLLTTLPLLRILLRFLVFALNTYFQTVNLFCQFDKRGPKI